MHRIGAHNINVTVCKISKSFRILRQSHTFQSKQHLDGLTTQDNVSQSNDPYKNTLTDTPPSKEEPRKFMDWAAKGLKIQELSDWYHVTNSDFTNVGGKSLLSSHSNSLFKLLSSTYPDFEWLPWKFDHITHFWPNFENQKKFMDWAGKELKIKEMSDWYRISHQVVKALTFVDFKDLVNLGGNTLLKLHANSLFKALSVVYPEYEWLPWRFVVTPRYFWAEIENQRKYMEWAGKELKIKEMSDWYHDLINIGGANLLRLHSNSMIKLLSAVYPDFEWLPWKFDTILRHFWPDIENQRKFMEWAGKQLKIKDKSEWYRVTSQDLIDLGGGSLLTVYYSSMPKLLSAVYPDHDWSANYFFRVPRNHWKDIKNQREYMDLMGKELKIKELSDWYNVTYREVIGLGASSLLHEHSNSLVKLLAAVYPEYEWSPYKFHRTPRNFWKDTKNQREFIELAGKKLKITDLNDWYKVTNPDLIKLGGQTLLPLYSDSLYKLLSTIYPEHEWLPWKFSQNTYWDDSGNWKEFFDYAASKLHIKEMSDWYKITAEQIIDLEGGILLVKNYTLFDLLSRVYPEFSWQVSKFSQLADIWNDEKIANYFVNYLKNNNKEVETVFNTIKNSEKKKNYPLTQLLKIAFPQYNWNVSVTSKTRKSQHLLKSHLHEIFPPKEVVMLEDYKHPDVHHLELDYFYPQQNLAFEYQGQQHYKNTSIFQRLESVDSLKKRDKDKAEICKELGITLIEIPYWWDRKLSSLAATIYNQRPDLFQVKPLGAPIPLNPITREKTNKNIKELFMTATEWDLESMEPKGWYMTEKYDGMRLFWTGTHFVSRLGNKIKVPESITKQLPSVALDGELWTQYGLYQDAVSLCKTTNETKWQKAIFWVFDSPEIAQKPIEERIEFLQQLQLPSFAKIVEFVKCEGKEHLKQFNEEILKKGGEGVMLREPGSVYKVGRSTSLRRFKPFLDTEVRIKENQYPHGFICEQMNEREVFVKITDNALDEMKQLQIGDVITVKHSGVNVYGTLIFPQFYRKRLDVKWDDLNKAL